MIPENKKEAIRTLYDEGRKKKEIARLLNIAPKTVRKILRSNGTGTPKVRKDKKEIDIDLLKDLYERCDGYAERVYEILTEEHKIKIGYSTLTRLIREHGIGQKKNQRCGDVPDVPGEEMQHDTTTYMIKLDGKRTKVVCSGLYFRYSKIRYIKFYRRFNRFTMKCFIDEALRFWGYVAKICIIDNTNLAVLYGTGKNAVMVPEMDVFAASHGFKWKAHEKGHANRKAGKERNFWTVETNFLPGRTFKSLEDMNKQALAWATDRYAHRPQSKTRLIPIELFEKEKPFLNKIPAYVHPPYLPPLERNIDQYGYVAFNGNYYWVPGKSRGKANIIEYGSKIEIYQKKEMLIKYDLPDWKIKNKKFIPEGVNTNPYEPNNRKKGCGEEEKFLRDTNYVCCDYLDFIKSNKSDVKLKPKFIRDLYNLSKKMTRSLFLECIKRALKYHISNIASIERIATQLVKNDLYKLPEVSINNDYENREEYQKGRFSNEADPDTYQKLIEGDDKKDEDNTDDDKDNKE